MLNTFYHLLYLILLFIVKSDNAHNAYVIERGLDQKLVTAGESFLKEIYLGTTTIVKGLIALELLSLNSTLQKKTQTSSLAKIDPYLIFKQSRGTSKSIILRQEKLARIIAIMWQLSKRATVQGEGFVSGSFKIIDPDYKLYNYLRDYTTLASLESSSLAYERNPKVGRSSHYKAFSPESQYGIDIRFKANEAALKLLPYGKAHILFGKLVIDPKSNTPLIFI